MSDQTSIFEDKSNSGVTAPNTTPNSNGGSATVDSEVTDLLNGIKNERGEPKYKTLKDALVGLQNAQTYIPDLKKNLSEREAEVERLRKESERVQELEETVRKLAERADSGSTNPKSLTEKEIADLVNKSLENTLTQRETQTKQKANIEIVVSKLKSTFGDSAETKFNEKAAELGMSVAEFNALAAKSPQIVLTALGVSAAQSGNTNNTKGTVNSEGFVPNPQSFIKRNDQTALTGATSQRVKEEQEASAKFVDELHKSGRTVHDLTNPKVYAQVFGGF